MSHKRRKLLLGLGFAASTPWVKPVVDTVILPAHAQCSDCATLTPDVFAQNTTCTPGSPSMVTFELCNNEEEPIIATSLSDGLDSTAVHISPEFPFTIQPGECVACSAQGASDTVFDCSGDFGFGYYFTSESGRFEGIAGGVNPLL